MAYNYEMFKKAIFELSGIDLSCYKEKQMKRRIDAFLEKYSLPDYSEFLTAMKKDTELFESFITYLTINVSEFFRNVDQWKIFEKDVLPQLIKRFGKRLVIWSAACSTGDEPYTLVMLLAQYMPLEDIKIIATDLDKQIIEKAKLGVYNEKRIISVPESLKNKYFKKEGNEYVIDDAIKRRVEFRQHNLLKDPFIKNCNLIVCRNVLIYFTEEAKDEVFRKFNKSLVDQGVLFIGSTEQMMGYRDFGYKRLNSFYYIKD